MTKILYVIDSLNAGGAERQLSLLLKYLPPAWETRVASLAGGPYHQVLLDQKTPVVVFQRRSRFDLAPVFRLNAEILRYKPDLVHSWGGLSSAMAAPLCKLLNIRFVDGSIRIAGGSNRHALRRRITFALSDRVIANSYAGLAAYPVPAKKGGVIYNALDPDRLARLQKKPDLPLNGLTVVMAARISRFKDFPLLFEAARRLTALDPGCWKFLAVGAGSDADRQNLVRQAGDLISARVVETPNAGLEVFPYLQSADIGVLLSAACFKEGISNSIMEYMACGLPVICSDSGGNRELVVDGETGFVIPPENPDVLVEKLLFLRDHPDVLRQMGEAGEKRITSLCSIESMVSRYESLYSGLLDRK